jgi:multifunctional methyltransferase subunit TRM112
MLQCHVKNCNNNNFPLRFEEVQVELIEADFNPQFLSNMLNKIEWEALVNTAVQVKRLTWIFEIERVK